MESNTLSLSASPIKEVPEDEIPDPYLHCILHAPVYIIAHSATLHLGKRKEHDKQTNKDKENIERAQAKYKKAASNCKSIRKPLQAIRA
jgi:hypothetical protein